MSVNQLTPAEKAAQFVRLHAAGQTFVIPNPWDVGSARLLASLGFEALATSSAGLAFTRGLPDGRAGRAATLLHLREIAEATALPVSADLENGFGDAPDTVAETLRLAARAGVVGGSIEDATGHSEAPLYALPLATERIRAAAEAARALPYPFLLTARAENFLVGRPDLGDVIRRLQAYQEAGADVLFAPGLTSVEQIATVLREIDRPLNVIMGLRGVALDVSALRGLGVARISLGGSLARYAFAALISAATEVRDVGSFGYAETAVEGRWLNEVFRHSAMEAS